MSSVTVRNLPPATNQAPKVGIGTLLAAIGSNLGTTELHFPRDQRPVEFESFKTAPNEPKILGITFPLS